MSFALKKIVFSVTMACFVLAGQGVASAKTAAKDPVVHAIAKAKGKKVQKPAAKRRWYPGPKPRDAVFTGSLRHPE